MISSLVLNANDDIAFFYGAPIGFTPRWASIDIELGELYIVGDEDEGELKPHKLERISERVYLRACENKKILLVEVADNDVRKPVNAVEVPLMVPNQPWEEEKEELRKNPKIPPHLQR